MHQRQLGIRSVFNQATYQIQPTAASRLIYLTIHQMHRKDARDKHSSVSDLVDIATRNATGAGLPESKHRNWLGALESDISL